MDTTKRIPRLAVLTAVVVGLAAGSYGVASAASGSGSSSSATTPSAATAQTPPAGQPFGAQRSDETPLTGDTAAKVEAVAKAKVPGGTVIRVETDADGNAKYEAHMTDASGNPVTVYVDESFNLVSVQTGGPGGPGGARGPGGVPPTTSSATG
jgi:hypothetical protein